MYRLSFLLVGLLAVGVARADEPLLGRFRLRVPEEAMRMARLSGRSAPTGRLSLEAGGTFALQSEGATRKGHYRLAETHLVLVAEDGGEMQGEVKGACVTVEGLTFDKEAALDLTGAWTTRRNGYEERGLRMELKKDGTFRFAMAGATSKGNWTVVDGKLALVWTEIDGDAVDLGTVRKEFPISEDGISFQIDTYRYERATVQP